MIGKQYMHCTEARPRECFRARLAVLDSSMQWPKQFRRRDRVAADTTAASKDGGDGLSAVAS